VLDGGEGDDLLDGGAADDVVIGGPGDDELIGGFGRDHYSGGPGNDVLEPREAAASGLRRERVRCGTGRDVVDGPGLALVGRDCERVSEVGWHAVAYPRTLGRGRLVFTLRTDRLRGGRLELRLRDRDRGAPFAVRRLAAGRRVARVRVRVPPEVRRLRRRPLAVQVRLTGRLRRTQGVRFERSWVIDLPR